MPQTSYALDLTAALPGQLADGGPNDITSAPAAEAIPAGRAVVIKSDGTVELPKSTAAMPSAGAGSFYGVSIYTSASPAGGYAAGDMVPLLRKGRIYVDFAGTGATVHEALTIRHASDDTNSEVQHRGKFSDIAAATTDGQEATATTKALARSAVSATLACVEVNLP